MATRRSDTDGGTGLPTPVVEDLLAETNRRIALSILADADEPIVVESLAAEVVAKRDGCAPEDVDPDAQAAMREELFTDHIPKLTATDVLEYDSMVGTVELTRPELVDEDRLAEFR
jgi:hypothetical protein